MVSRVLYLPMEAAASPMQYHARHMTLEPALAGCWHHVRHIVRKQSRWLRGDAAKHGYAYGPKAFNTRQ